MPELQSQLIGEIVMGRREGITCEARMPSKEMIRRESSIGVDVTREIGFEAMQVKVALIVEFTSHHSQRDYRRIILVVTRLGTSGFEPLGQ